MAKQLEHSDLFKGFMRGVIKVVSYLKFNLLICGQENIPESGPVIIAPRHFHGDYDPILFNTIIRRKAFFLGATDWMKDGVQLTVNKFIFQKFGVVPINRPDSIFEKQNHNLLTAYKTIVNWLMLDQAVIIFPEGYGFIDSHYKKPSADGEFLEVKAGLFHFIDYVQKKKNIRIPIIPIGTMYSNLEHFKNNIVINIGRPIYLPISSGKIDFEPYRQKLQHEIRSLSDLGKELEQAELTLVPQAA
jgi:1-acyl-sn-glycerol-3-phosphate acyltransferase